MTWSPAVRIVSARHTPAAAFERIADREEAAELLQIIAAGRPARFDPADVTVGDGAGWIVAAFLRGGAARFNDETFGAFYAAREEATAVMETQFHYARFLRDAREGYVLLGARVLLADVDARPVDIRARSDELSEIYDPEPAHYSAAQRWAAEQRREGADGIVYDSVRRSGGECVAIFRPRLITSCRVGDQLAYEWGGEAFVATYTLSRRELE
ncbi:MAG TPA: RES family NAD+ phosphorylase [Gemmatimonadaceae bacterium]